MAQAQTLFVTDDGKTFATIDEATAHEEAVQLRAKLGEYAAAARMSRAQVTHLEKHLTAFRLFAEHGVMPEAPKARKPRAPKTEALPAA